MGNPNNRRRGPEPGVLTCRADLGQTQELDKLSLLPLFSHHPLASQGSSLTLLGWTMPHDTLLLDLSFNLPPHANSAPLGLILKSSAL